MESDDTAPLPADPAEAPFEYGDKTICRMWRQPFELAGTPADLDDLGTMVVRPLRPAVAQADPAGPTAGAAHEDEIGVSTIMIRPHPVEQGADEEHERMVRLEAKVDTLTAAVENLQKSLGEIQEFLIRTR